MVAIGEDSQGRIRDHNKWLKHFKDEFTEEKKKKNENYPDFEG